MVQVSTDNLNNIQSSLIVDDNDSILRAQEIKAHQELDLALPMETRFRFEKAKVKWYLKGI